MHKKNLFKKSLVVGIICVLLLTISSTLGQNILIEKSVEVEKEKIVRLENIRGNEEKPDLAIVAIVVHPESPNYWRYNLYVLNDGNAPLPAYRLKIVRLFVKPLHSQKIVRDITTSVYWLHPSPHYPGEVDKNYEVNDPDLSSGEYRCFFEVAPNHQWDEWNYTNNRMWAYYRFYFTDPFARQLSELQPWETGNEGFTPGNKVINKPFLRFLETFTADFPLIQQLLELLLTLNILKQMLV